MLESGAPVAWFADCGPADAFLNVSSRMEAELIIGKNNEKLPDGRGRLVLTEPTPETRCPPSAS
jgi:hypothetical protein